MALPLRSPFLVLLPVLLALSGCRLAAPPASPPRKTALYQPLPPIVNAPSRIRFVEVGASAGLNYRWTIPGKQPFTLLQTIGDGCAFLDFDRDGNLDILLVGFHPALFRGDGKGRFRDVTREMGLDHLTGRFIGCAVGDYDNDGYADLYLSGYQTGALLHNEAGRRFIDVTARSGLRPQQWGTSCAFADLNGDGRLDLFIADYVRFDAASPQLCQQNGVLTACSPRTYPPLRSVICQNRGGGKFEDVTQRQKAVTSGNSLGVAAAEFDHSGAIGIAVANDEANGDLFQNAPGHRPFTNVNASSGTATDRFGHRHGAMGIDWGDYDNDGQIDLFVTTFAHEDKCLYRNLGDAVFEERGVETGVASALKPYVSFGCKFADFDNDGWLDLIVASGHIGDNIAVVRKGETYRQPIELLQNAHQNTARFVRVTQSAGLLKLPPIVGRGLAVGDYDNDGRMDALIVDSEGAPLLLHNETPQKSHWLGVALRGRGKSNRDAYGATITVEIGKRRLMRLCRADGSYLSSSDSRVHFGLGEASFADKIIVRWPDGRTQTRSRIAADSYLNWNE